MRVVAENYEQTQTQTQTHARTHARTHAHTHTHTHTHTPDNYSNPRCAHARRELIIIKRVNGALEDCCTRFENLPVAQLTRKTGNLGTRGTGIRFLFLTLIDILCAWASTRVHKRKAVSVTRFGTRVHKRKAVSVVKDTAIASSLR